MEPNYNSPPHPNQYLYQSPHQPTMFLSHPNLALNLNHSHDSNNTSSDVDGREKVPMFEKPLTPSDVGKLNRLVIPKQHAEKYFPLGGCGDAAGDKGLLLSFEDESGKCWRFRYSYWNSSQSYVLTKGWSRYVKEKQLDAGDVILFLRHRTDTHRLFIGWRRRGAETAVTTVLGTLDRGSGNEIAGWSRAYQNPYLGQVQEQGQPTECLNAGSVEDNEAAEANPRRLLRLFGVNLECHGEPQSSTTLHHPHDSFYSSNFMPCLFLRLPRGPAPGEFGNQDTPASRKPAFVELQPSGFPAQSGAPVPVRPSFQRTTTGGPPAQTAAGTEKTATLPCDC